MTKYPPKYPSGCSPQEVIGVNRYDAFCEHARLYFDNCKDGEFPEAKLKRAFAESDRKKIAETISRLNQFGYAVLGVGTNGQPIFGVVTKSQVDTIFHNGELQRLKGLSRDELGQIARGKYRQMMTDNVV